MAIAWHPDPSQGDTARHILHSLGSCVLVSFLFECLQPTVAYKSCPDRWRELAWKIRLEVTNQSWVTIMIIAGWLVTTGKKKVLVYLHAW